MSTAEDGGPGGDDADRGRWSGLRVEGGSEYTVDLGCVGMDMALLNGLLMDRSYMMLIGVCRMDHARHMCTNEDLQLT